MAVLNPPQALPYLGRAIVNHLLISRAEFDLERLGNVFSPGSLDEEKGAVSTIVTVLSSIDVLEMNDGAFQPTETVRAWTHEKPLDPDAWRRLLRSAVLNPSRDGDPFRTKVGKKTAGGRDIARALTWFLAQDALGPGLRWDADDPQASTQTLQDRQFPDTPTDERPIQNNTRFGALSRWAPALGFADGTADPSGGLLPLPVTAIRDVVSEMPRERHSIRGLLDALATELPVLWPGPWRNSMVEGMSEDADPDAREGLVDSSVAQALRTLVAEGQIEFERLPDVEAASFRLLDDKGQPASEAVSHVVIRKSR